MSVFYLFEQNKMVYVAIDGKGMQVAHHHDGAKCWICSYDPADPAALQPVATVSSIHVSTMTKEALFI